MRILCEKNLRKQPLPDQHAVVRHRSSEQRRWRDLGLGTSNGVSLEASHEVEGQFIQVYL